MKTPLLTVLKCLALTSAASFLTVTAPAKIFDGGIDSANLGRGNWIWYVSWCTNNMGGNVPSVVNIPTMMTYFKTNGIDYIVVKAGTGSTNFNGGGSSPQFNQELVNEAHAAGLKIMAYTRSYGSDVPGEVAMAHAAYDMGADGFVIDAESEWESHQPWIGANGPTLAMQMGSMIKTNYPTKFLAHAPFPYISFHSSFPYKEFGYWCDAVMPQTYWFMIGVTPQTMVDDLDSQWRSWQNGLTGQWTNSIKPIAPIGEANSDMSASDIPLFIAALKATKNPASAGGYQGVSYWRADLQTAAHMQAIATNVVGSAMGTVNPILMDNISATYSGTWSTGTGSTDKYATDYRYKGPGTTAYAQFKPSFWTAGNYQVSEWHPQGSNRSTNAPHEITYNGGVSTVNVNQQINGGQWNILGTFNFNAGTGNRYVRVKDTFTGSTLLAMADGIRFTYVAPAVPSAPSGLTATALSGTKISLTWTDNSSNEEWFIVRRSTTSGGPYSNVMILAANSTSYIDTGLTGSTTYYYVIRAAHSGGNSVNSGQASATTGITVPDIIIDNPSATVVGTWTTASSSTDKYGADYRYKGQGTGAAYLEYTPTISVAGDYEVHEWHPQGANRTSAGQHEINYNGGSTTVGVNQQSNGGRWNLLGTFNFAAGTTGNIRIKDNHPDAGQLVMADAIKLVFVAATQNPPPNAPSGLTATAMSSSQINLAWTDNSNNEASFIVGRSTTSGGPYADIVTLAANTTSYNNTGLNASTTYYYVVRARNADGDSANSNQASATTQAPPPPAAPSGLTANAVSSSQINLAWTDNSGNETSFIVGRSTTSGGPYTDVVTLGANVVSYNNTGLNASTTYYYVVRARNANGDSANSNQASATTQAPPPPTAPSGLSATPISPAQIDLVWSDNSSDESNFIIARSTVSGGPYTDIVTLAAGSTSYSNTGLAANTAYHYVVRARGTGGDSANSAQASATTFQISPPTAPSGLSATPISQTEISLSWTDNASSEDSFIIARSTVSGGPFTDIATVGANTTAYANNTGLTPGTTYYYVVRARNAGGDSANSNEASAATLPNPPTAPSGLSATPISSSQINLAWTDNSSNEANFIVGRSTTSGGPYTDIVTLGANVTSYSNTGLTPNTTYYYVVRARNTGGSSGNSNQASATTLLDLPNAPSGLSATAIRASQVNLAWTDNSANESNFILSRSTTSGSGYVDIVTLGANVTSYNNTGLAANTTYYYVVRASNASGSSANSAEASATTYETDLLVDNKSATVVGTWSTGTASADKYGADYRFIGPGAGANYLQFTPYVATAGAYEVYQWHPQGANRPTNAPIVINYNGGSQTVFVNQEINGGTWVLLGSWNFAAGSAGNIRISDNFVDPSQVIMADAIKLAPVPPPSAPGGLTATAISSSQINLAWTDNSANEVNFIIARSTTSGGPYTDIATVAANSTAYNNTGLAASTTYYYVVRAVNGGGSSPNSNQASATTAASLPPTFVAAGSFSSGIGSIIPALPAGIASGDILLLFVETGNEAVSVSNPNGGTWAEVTGSPQGTGTAGGASSTRLTVFWSRYNGTQGAPTISDSGNHQIARMIAIRSAAASGNPWDVTAGGIESTSDASASIPGATTTVDNTLVVVAVAGSLPDANGTANFSGWANASLTGLTERIDNTRSEGNGGAIGVATGVKATAGAYGATSATHASAAVKGMISIAIKNQ